MFRPLDFLQANPKGDDAFLNTIFELSILSHGKGFVSPLHFDIQAAKVVWEAKNSESTPAITTTTTATPVSKTTTSILMPKPDSRPDSTYSLSSLISFEPPASTPTHPHTSQTPLETLLLQKLSWLEKSLTTTVESTLTHLDEANTTHTLLATSLLTHLETLSQRLANLEATQRGIKNHMNFKNRRSAEVRLADGHFRCLSEQSLNVVSRGEDEGSSPRTNVVSPDGMKVASPVSATAVGSPRAYPKLPAEVVNAGLEKRELMRLSVVYELIETEADYIRDLGIMVNVHKQEMTAWKILDDATIDTIFSNVAALIAANT
ncbi:hypothetical protein HDU98_011268, partial [Podochytrium sp. JEL0797]